jgi:hypothetical protein
LNPLTVVNKKYRYDNTTKNLATFTVILGVLTLMLITSALTEQSHEGHPLERNYRGTAGAIVASGIPGGLLILYSAPSGTGGISKRDDGTRRTPVGSEQLVCPAKASSTMM